MTALFAYVVSHLNPGTLEIGGEVAKRRPKVSGGIGTALGLCCCVVVIIAVVAVVLIVRKRRPKA